MSDELLDMRASRDWWMTARSEQISKDYADAIETGRQWETIARRLAEVLNLTIGAQLEADAPRWTAKRDEALAAFRALADGATEDDGQDRATDESWGNGGRP